MKIHTLEFVDHNDFSDGARAALEVFRSECGVGNGAHESIVVGERGDDSMIGSWIKDDAKMALIDADLKACGLKEGDTISILFEW